MKSQNIPAITIVASLAALGGIAIAAQDKYTVRVPLLKSKRKSKSCRLQGRQVSYLEETDSLVGNANSK